MRLSDLAADTRRCLALIFVFLASTAVAAVAQKVEPRQGKDQQPERLLTRTEGPGLSARYPQDRGISKNRSVIFATGFEKGIRGGLKKRRNGVEILIDSKTVRSGKACAKITATRGKDTGGDLVFTWKKGVDRCYVRFYCRFDKDTVTPHHFVNLSGHMPTHKYRFGGGAGFRPPGGVDGKFGTTIEPPQLDRSPKGRKGWMFYTYWHEMRSWQKPNGESDGRPNAFYGNSFLADGQRPFVGREKWICVEFMVQLNKLGKHDGEQAVWIDGKKVGHWGPGFPVGTPIRGRFVTSGVWNKDSRPFRGFSWRTHEGLKINRTMLQWYVSAESAKKGQTDKNIVYFDNLVVATKYIDPIREKLSSLKFRTK